MENNRSQIPVYSEINDFFKSISSNLTTLKGKRSFDGKLQTAI
jgi:hypothetical protein